MDEFTRLINELQNNLDSNRDFFKTMVKKNPSQTFYKLNELCKFVGSRYGVILEIHFPDSRKILDTQDYGKENISIIIDKFKKTFPIERRQIKITASELLSENIQIIDAYMYEGKEGIKIIFQNQNNNNNKSSRIELLPGSFHLWVKLDQNIENFCNWLLSNVYTERKKLINK